jgi:hypothetical protein
MFKYTKRLIAEIHFWCQEIKIRSRGNVEFERVIPKRDKKETQINYPK